MDREQLRNHDEDYPSGGKWLSCDSKVGQISRRKVKGQSRRRQIPRQKKLPRHWRENDDSLLTELDLLRPNTPATKQSSLLSYMCVSEDLKSLDSSSPQDASKSRSVAESHSLSNSEQGAVSLDGKGVMEVKTDGGPHSQQLFSDWGESVRDKKSPGEPFQEEDCFKDEHREQKPETRLFVPLMVNEKNRKPDFCDRSQPSEDKEFSILSLRKKYQKEGYTGEKTEMRKALEWRGETIADRLSFSQFSSSEEDVSDKPECLYKNQENIENENFPLVPKGVHSRERPHLASFSEDSLSFSETEGNLHHSYLTLKESQKVQKELYKAQMGTLEFSDLMPDLCH